MQELSRKHYTWLRVNNVFTHGKKHETLQ